MTEFKVYIQKFPGVWGMLQTPCNDWHVLHVVLICGKSWPHGQLETVEMETRNGKWKQSNHLINVCARVKLSFSVHLLRPPSWKDQIPHCN